ncbi:MAG TPA: hypothetical protein VN081_03990 [Dongiaceae bacterium]|nr:hypothetical protein [Dongiaceae bacterium]
MDHDQIVAWVAENQEYYVRLYGLENWTIDFLVEEEPESNLAGTCEADFEYETATIALYSENIDGLDELIETVCHELEHVLLSPFTTGFQLCSPFMSRRGRELAVVFMGHLEEKARNMVGRLRLNLLALQEENVEEVVPLAPAPPTITTEVMPLGMDTSPGAVNVTCDHGYHLGHCLHLKCTHY